MVGASPRLTSALGQSFGAGSVLKVGEDLGPLLLKSIDLGPQLLQLTVDARQFGLCPELSVVTVVVSAVHEVLDFAPKKPQPRVAVDHAYPVLKLTTIDRCDYLVLSEAEFLARVLIAEGCALAAPLLAS